MTKNALSAPVEPSASTVPSPREMMRARHPDLFSDSTTEIAPRVSKEVFEYHLDTLTSRKQEYEFEHFCRKLAEKELCPNLRVQTGPTGGGDSKVDTETFPVAAEIAERWWAGEAAAGSERWGFAFSAKKAWAAKVRADVANIYSTGRDYKRIYFFTNQFVSDKQRSKVEDDLTKEFGIPVHLVDRAWIVDRVFEHGHLDIAIATLGLSVGQERSEAAGPHDAARIVELSELDSQIADPDRYQDARYQLVEDVLRSAVVARGLERPRYEVEGRFHQAEALAQQLKFPQQLMRVAYNRAWTAHWWYEDYDAFLTYYQQVEDRLADSEVARDHENLLNLWHLLSAGVRQGRIVSEAVRLDEREQLLRTRLVAIAADEARPNNALEAKTMLVLVAANGALSAGSQEGVDAAWREMTGIVRDASRMGQYPLEPLADLVGELGDFADGEAFDELFETLVGAMRDRRSEGQAGNAYRERGVQRLQRDRPYEAIHWLGRAERLLVKEEYQSELVATLVASSYAYERAGLLWAARNKMLVAAERNLTVFLKTGQMTPLVLRCLNRLVWLELQLGRVPHVLRAMEWASIVAAHLGLSPKQGELQGDEVRLQEAVLGIHLLNIPVASLCAIEQLPDALERLGLTNARLAALFALKQERVIRAEGYYPEESTEAEMLADVERWRAQPAADDIPPQPTMLEGSTAALRSVILGEEFVVVAPVNQVALAVAESLLGAMEEFLSTSNESDLLPHRESTTIVVRLAAEANTAPTFRYLEDTGRDPEILVSKDFEIAGQEDFSRFSDWLAEGISMLAARCFSIRNPEAWVKSKADDEQALSRAIILGDMLTIGRNAFGYAPRLRLRDWIESDDKIYENQRTTAWSPRALPAATGDIEPPRFGDGPAPKGLFDRATQRHSDRRVLSPIDIPLWNQANWRGTLFAVDEDADGTAPVLGLMFGNPKAGAAIFEGWRSRWGIEDKGGALRVVIITGVSQREPAHYSILIGPNLDASSGNGKSFVMVARHCRMTPSSTANLDRFLAAYRRHGRFLLVPAAAGSPPSFDTAVALGKHLLEVKPAWTIGENDFDASAIYNSDDPIIPSDTPNPPILKAMERMRRLRSRAGDSDEVA